jgi:hypothetical protein
MLCLRDATPEQKKAVDRSALIATASHFLPQSSHFCAGPALHTVRPAPANKLQSPVPAQLPHLHTSPSTPSLPLQSHTTTTARPSLATQTTTAVWNPRPWPQPPACQLATGDCVAAEARAWAAKHATKRHTPHPMIQAAVRRRCGWYTHACKGAPSLAKSSQSAACSLWVQEHPHNSSSRLTSKPCTASTGSRAGALAHCRQHTLTVR